MKTSQIITAIIVLALGTLFTSCTEQDGFYSYSGQLVNKHSDVKWTVQESPNTFIEVREDIKAGIMDELVKLQEEHPDAELTSVKVASCMIISEDLYDFSYLDELSLYIVDAQRHSNVELPAEDKGVLIGTFNPEQREQSHLNIKVSGNELLSELANDEYDLYFIGKTNSPVHQSTYEERVEVKLTFQIEAAN